MIKWRKDSIKAIREKKEQVKRLEEQNAALEAQLVDTQLALCDVYEQLIAVAMMSEEGGA